MPIEDTGRLFSCISYHNIYRFKNKRTRMDIVITLLQVLAGLGVILLIIVFACVIFAVVTSFADYYRKTRAERKNPPPEEPLL